MPFQPTAIKGGVLHHYTPDLIAFEHPRSSTESQSHPNSSSPSQPLTTASPIHSLVVIGGLFDGILTVPYTTPLAARLPPSWRLIQPNLHSSYQAFGTHTLDDDVVDLGALTAYLRVQQPRGKIVLMGHSTGCQDAMHYVLSPSLEHLASSSGNQSESDAHPSNPSNTLESSIPKNPRVDGIILQAPASDREEIERRAGADRSSLDTAIQTAQAWTREGRDKDVLPQHLTRNIYGPGAYLTARRFLDLVSPPPAHDGADDYFSSDLPDTRLQATFGRLLGRVPRVLILIMGADEYVPSSIDKQALLDRWRRVVEGDLSADSQSESQSRDPHAGNLQASNAEILNASTSIESPARPTNTATHSDKDVTDRSSEDNWKILDRASAVVAGASHKINQEDEGPRQDVYRRVLAFLERLA